MADRGDNGLPLFTESSRSERTPIELALAVIDRDLAIWDGLERRTRIDPRVPEGDRRRLTDLGRELRGLRECYRAARHPRVQRALLREAVRVTRQMRALGNRLHVRGLDVVAVA